MNISRAGTSKFHYFDINSGLCLHFLATAVTFFIQVVLDLNYREYNQSRTVNSLPIASD
jgi:hypothetical protein